MKKYVSHLLEGGWNIAVRRLPCGTILQDRDTQFEIISNTWRTWAADPFLFRDNDELYIFAELYDYIHRKGSIGYTKLINGKWSKWRVVLDEPFHMSYPNIFKVEGNIFMVPETSAGHALRLYRASVFPNEWECVKNIAEDIMWVDTTFFKADGNIHALTTDVSDENNHKDYLLSFDEELNLITKQLVHEDNINYSRPGGNFFFYNNMCYRVSQDCSSHYGGGMIFTSFDTSNVLCGLGDEILHIFPKDIQLDEKHNWSGVHTYNSLDDYEVIDIERKHFNIFGIFSRLFLKLKRWDMNYNHGK